MALLNVSEQRMNLTALQRADSKIIQIIDHASQVALYKFNDEGKEWEKPEIEGTLFVYVRSELPFYGFIVMNRLNTTNFIEPINSDLDFQLQTPFLLYRNSTGSIYGIWFYNKEECLRVEKVLLRLADYAQGRKLVGRNRCASEGGGIKSDSNSNKQQDILSLLSHAQQEYDMQNHSPKTLKIEPKPEVKLHNQGNVIKPTPVRASNGYVAENDNQNGTPLSVATLFSQITASQRRSSRGTPRNAPPMPHRSISMDVSTPHDPNAKNIIQHLMANPQNCLEHIEKLQRDQSATQKAPRARATSCSAMMGPHVLSPPKELTAHIMELDIKEKLKLIKVENERTETLPRDIPKPKLFSRDSSAMDDSLIAPAMFEMSFKTPSPPFHVFPNLTSPCEELFSSETSRTNKPPDASEVPLLSPLAFTKPLISTPFNFSNVQSSPQEMWYQKRASRDNGLLLPEQLESYSLPSLTKEQLRESLVYLLKNDDDFLCKIHDAYATSLKSLRFKT